MQRKAVLIFIIMSAILMGGYLVCIATSPNPPWTPVGSKDSGTQTWTNHDNAHARVYCAYNYYTSGGVKKWRTYHWGHLDVASNEQRFTFLFEWKRGDGGVGDPNIKTVSNWGSYDITSNTMDAIWESEFTFSEINVTSGQRLYPYSALRSNDGRPQEATEVNWQPNGIEIP